MVPDRSLCLVVSKKVCKFSLSFFVFYSLFFLLFPESLLIHIPRICCFGFFHRTLARSKSTDLFVGIDVLIFIVLLYFLQSLSIPFVVHMHHCTCTGTSISIVSDVPIGFIHFQYWIPLFLFGYKSNKLFISQQRFHLFVFFKSRPQSQLTRVKLLYFSVELAFRRLKIQFLPCFFIAFRFGIYIAFSPSLYHATSNLYRFDM